MNCYPNDLDYVGKEFLREIQFLQGRIDQHLKTLDSFTDPGTDMIQAMITL
jgi:hypothetical protein